MFSDTGINIPERLPTLQAQQLQLCLGLRAAQMFPRNTPEIAPLPWAKRVETNRGVFHYDPSLVSAEKIIALSNDQRENEILSLGPFNKRDVLRYLASGDTAFGVTERLADGTEVKAAIGCQSTIPMQVGVFEQTKLPASVVAVEPIEEILTWRKHHG